MQHPGVAASWGVEIDSVKCSKGRAYMGLVVRDLEEAGLLTNRACTPCMVCVAVEQVRRFAKGRPEEGRRGVVWCSVSASGLLHCLPGSLLWLLLCAGTRVFFMEGWHLSLVIFAAFAHPQPLLCIPATVLQLSTLEPATHAYACWEGMPRSAKVAFGSLFVSSASLQVCRLTAD